MRRTRTPILRSYFCAIFVFASFLFCSSCFLFLARWLQISVTTGRGVARDVFPLRRNKDVTSLVDTLRHRNGKREVVVCLSTG
jgi:hypothetical protein